MIGFLINRVLVLMFGYVYPAYECYKTVEMNKPNIDQLLFWCQYWILVAGLTVCERIGDAFIGWVPMYGEAKLAFFVYLWFPKTKGTAYVYDSFFRPYVAKHETDIDRNLLELRTRAGDMLVLYWQKAASYGQTRFFDILQYIASQSSHPKSDQKPDALRNRKPDIATQPRDGGPPSFNPTPSSERPEDTSDEAGPRSPPEDSKIAPVANSSSSNEQKTTASQSLVEKVKTSDEGQTMQIDSMLDKNTEPLAADTGSVEGARATRARSRRPRAGSSR